MSWSMGCWMFVRLVLTHAKQLVQTHWSDLLAVHENMLKRLMPWHGPIQDLESIVVSLIDNLRFFSCCFRYTQFQDINLHYDCFENKGFLWIFRWKQP